jgi:hypothetical protein
MLFEDSGSFSRKAAEEVIDTAEVSDNDDASEGLRFDRVILLLTKASTTGVRYPRSARI